MRVQRSTPGQWSLRSWLRPELVVALGLWASAACGGTDPGVVSVGPAPAAVGVGQHSADAAVVVGDAALAAADASTAVGAAAGDAAAAAQTLHVLFVGNSYTSTNDLPAWVQRLAASEHKPPQIQVEAITPGGVSFADHWMSTGALARIQQGGLTHVVLQAQSVEPVGFTASFEQYGELLIAEVKKAGATPVLYETWARQAGDAVYAETWSGGNPTAMQAGLRSAYVTLAQKAGAREAPVGDAWQTVLSKDSKIPLFAPDGSHPTEHGTYLAACVIYETLTGRSPVGIADHPASVTLAESSTLANVAHATVSAK
ncbi:MAG TPA: DUF4886 domain-containing protein [Polyangiales bacterium]